MTTFTLTINTSKTYSDGTTAPETWLALMDATEADENLITVEKRKAI